MQRQFLDSFSLFSVLSAKIRRNMKPSHLAVSRHLLCTEGCSHEVLGSDNGGERAWKPRNEAWIGPSLPHLRWLALCLVGFSAATVAAQIPAGSLPSPPVFLDFEAPDFQPGSVDGQWGWWVDQGVGAIVPGLGLEGSAALSIEPAEPFSQGRLSFQRLTTSGTGLFIDFHVRLQAADWYVLDETFDIDSARIGLFRTTLDPSLAEWHVFHGNGQEGGTWLDTGVAAAVDPLTNATFGWTRLTVKVDPSGNTWDLWVDGVLVAAELGFQITPEPDRTHFFVLGDSLGPVIIDDFRLSLDNPPGLADLDPPALPPPPDGGGTEGDPSGLDADELVDSDADGLPDVWEMSHGMNAKDPADAASDLDGDGLTALDEFLLGSNAAGKDVRRAVSSQTAEVFNRFAGVSARRVAAPGR